MAIGTPTKIAANSGTSVSSVAVTVPAGGVALGSKIIVFAGSNGASTPTFACADTQGNTYSPDDQSNYTGADKTYICLLSAQVGTALVSGNTITVSTGGVTVGAMEVIAYSVTGLATSSALDQHTHAAPGTTGTPNSGNVTTTQANELLFGALGSFTGPNSAGAGWTSLDTATVTRFYLVEYQIVSSTGTFAATGGTSVQEWNAIIATYKAPGVSGNTYIETGFGAIG